MAPSKRIFARDHANIHPDAAVTCDDLSQKRTFKINHRSILKVLGVLQALLLVAFAFVAQQEKGKTASNTSIVHNLADDTISSFVINFSDGALVNFHSPGCSHCIALAVEFEAAAQELHSRGGAPLASVNVATAPRAAERYGVHRYPTMLWFKKGERVLELPPTIRNASKIVEYVDWAVQPAIVSFDTRTHLDEAVPHMRAALYAGAPPVIVGFGMADGVYDALEAAGERFRGKTVFVFTKDANVDDPTLRAYFREPSSDYDFSGTVDVASVQAWVEALIHKSKKAAQA